MCMYCERNGRDWDQMPPLPYMQQDRKEGQSVVTGNMINPMTTTAFIRDYRSRQPELVVLDRSFFLKYHNDPTGIGTVYIPIKFCPECGRRLGKADPEAAEKGGMILRFPCKIGDTVYLPNRDDEDAIIRHRIVKIGVNAEFGMFFVIDDEDRDEHPIDLFGKEVFLSEEDAAAHYDKFLDGARKAMQFFGVKVGDKLLIPNGSKVENSSMEYCTVTAVGSDEQGPYFETDDRERPDKQRNKVGDYYIFVF